VTTKKSPARERNAAALSARVDALMSDTRYARLRSRRARVILVVLLAVTLAAQPAVWYVGGIVIGLAAVLVAFALWVALRLSVRVIADLPDEYLDERQRALRNAAYLESYRVLGALVTVAVLAMLLGIVFAGDGGERVALTVTFTGVMGIFWLVEGAALALPSMVFALRDRELGQ